MGVMVPPDRRALRVSAVDGSHQLDAIADPRVVGPIDYALSLGDAGARVTTLGAGPIAGSVVPGSNRLVVCGRSPLWGTFYPSTIGGAGLPWSALGLDFVSIDGRASVPSVLTIIRRRGVLEVAVTPLPDVEQVFAGHAGEVGLYALMRRVVDDHAGDLEVGRVLATGPAATRTRAGAIGSAPLAHGRPTNVDTWAGRGGLGSRLVGAHNLVAVFYGADRAPVSPVDRALIDQVFTDRFSRPMKLVDLESTAKYRFDPKFRSGGTFGANYHTLREKVLAFNYRSVLMDDETRLGIHDRLIQGHYLRQFDEEIIGKGNHFNCGEPCGAVCKKVDGKHKKDYEPYAALGPLVGVFDQRAAEQLTHHADACGFDAIQIGGEVAWVMECLKEGWLGEQETGIAERPQWEPEQFAAVEDSAHNARIARSVIDWLLSDPRAATLRRGLRAGSRAAGGAAAQAAVYAARGDGDGCMVPNQYWVPGMFAPMPILGRYYLDYSYEWKPPRELGRSCVARMVRELMLDNYGMCRFHRGWAEELLPELVNRARGIDVDPDAHHLRLARELHADADARPWQTERVVELIHGYLVKVRTDGPPEPELDRWVDRFGSDPAKAALAYWHELRAGIADALGTREAAGELLSTADEVR